jgi:hypothetical protein
MTHLARLLLVALILVAGPDRAFGQSPQAEGPI